MQKMFFIKREGPEYLKGSKFDETVGGVFKEEINISSARQKLEAISESDPTKASELADQLNLLVERRRQAQETLMKIEQDLAVFTDSLE